MSKDMSKSDMQPMATAVATSISRVTIGTHDGTFHADEALAIHMLQILPRYSHATVVRTRDKTILAQMDIVVDVGGVYDPKTHRYDHHQREFKDTFSELYQTRLSSAGLVYKHFGREIIHTLVPNLSISDLETVYQRTYRLFIEAIDGHDNGISQYPSEIKPAYAVTTSLPARVAHLNPSWNEDSTNQIEMLARFQKAMDMTGSEFRGQVLNLCNAWLPARQIVMSAMTTSCKNRILILPRYTVWQSHLYEIEKEMKLDEIYYVLYETQQTQAAASTWRIHCVPIAAGSFVSRKPLPVEWRGLSKHALSQACGISDCEFVHANGFIGGHTTYDGALAMATKALASATPVNQPAMAVQCAPNAQQGDQVNLKPALGAQAKTK